MCERRLSPLSDALFSKACTTPFQRLIDVMKTGFGRLVDCSGSCPPTLLSSPSVFLQCPFGGAPRARKHFVYFRSSLYK